MKCEILIEGFWYQGILDSRQGELCLVYVTSLQSSRWVNDSKVRLIVETSSRSQE